MSARTVVLTFDNLGAAAQVEAGLVAEGLPEADHPSLRALPGLLAVLRELELPATFFVEARNCELHPRAVRSIAEAGFEVGHHAWRHERWLGLDAAGEEDVLGRGMEAFAALDLAPRGFRPPGGGLSDASTRLLRAAGLDWASPEGDRVAPLPDAVVSVPFRWALVDALYCYPPFEALRVQRGITAEVVPPDAAVEQLWAELLGEPDPTAATLVLHPLLMVGDGEPDAHRALLRRLAAARDAGQLRVVDGRTLVDEVRGRTAPE